MGIDACGESAVEFFEELFVLWTDGECFVNRERVKFGATILVDVAQA